MTQHTQQSRSDTGAVLVHAALVLIGLLALSTFVIDYGVLWAARRQAQNAADAGALAGAVYVMFDTNLPQDPAALGSATAVASQNKVWAAVPFVDAKFACPTYVTFGILQDCVRVDVHRDQDHGNALPMLFGGFVGRSLQNIRATATARVNAANATDCLGPFAISDKYVDTVAPTDSFNLGDTYTPPGPSSTGTGYAVPTDVGRDLLVKAAGNEAETGPGWFRLLDLRGGGGGGTSELNEVIRSCTADIKGIGDDITENTESGLSAGIKHGIEDLISTDAGADWDPIQKKIVNSCVETSAPCYKFLPTGEQVVVDTKVSPRILAIPVFDPQLYATTGTIKIVNILGFFIWKLEGPGEKEVHGVLVRRPGVISSTKGSISTASSFQQVIQLIR